MTTVPRSRERQPLRPADDRSRYHLAGDFDPSPRDRHHCRPGDVWLVERERACLWVDDVSGSETGRGELRGHWLSEPRIRERSPVPLGGTHDLHFLAHEEPTLVATDVPSPSAVWFLTDDVPSPDFESKPSVRHFEFDRLRVKDEIRRFLEHPLVDHPRGHQTIWKAAFGARYQDALVAVAVLGIPNPPSRYDGQTIVIDRYASHPERPPNTGTWLLSRARKWARLEGYCWLAAKAGIGGNEGTVYEALGMEQLGPAETADGSGYANRPNRATWDDWEKRSFAQPLGPQGVRFRRYDKHDRWQKARGQDDALPGSHTRLSSFQRNETVGVDDCYLMRYDHHPEAVRDFFEACGKPTPTLVDATAVFVAAANAEPIAAIVCRPTDGTHTGRRLVLTAYAHRESGVKYPLNVGAWLAAQVRHWAALDGYGGVTGKAADDTHHAVLKRAGIPPY